MRLYLSIDFKKTKLINVIIAANPEYCNISNPGPLEQEQGRELGLIVLLHEYFYAG